ncbi:hypothetical protein [Mesorhizobium sp. B2-1-5]|uniref:hypothetical protein n=1 Tax=Mesorhizobium sp. B2-1-5 TaxID=2589969 RepID=UPI00112974A5|nr:hypothetical protein [Mesorhizobium sp. B2-1-5]TPN03015.1 hypothetical protein FJ966_01070 [Mesorhizobium sp. B2-1-5]
MSSYLNVSADDVQNLSDSDLRELVARLAQADVRSAGFSTNAVTWGGDQRAEDGGIDVRVALGALEKISGNIPASQTGFQVKTENFASADIVEEMMPRGAIRPSISELAVRKGAYVIVSSKSSVADSAHKRRLATMNKCLSEAGLAGKVTVEFYDRRRIATWIEKYSSLVAWVRELCGRSAQGWQSFGAWAHRETDVNATYMLDEKAKVLVPDASDGITVAAAIDRIRRDLNKERASVRITGLSGVGKTRLVQALFDERLITSSPPLNRNEVLYTDLSDDPRPVPIHLVEALHAREDRGLLVVDNCGFDLHQRLTEKVQQPNSVLSLVTVEYDLREHIPEGTSSYRLEPCSDELIRQLVSNRYPNLTRQDVETISDFSGGNVRVAFALAETSSIGGQLSKLEDEQLFIRLFQQTKAEDNELLRAAEVCSMLYSFEGELEGGDDAELPMLAALAGTSFNRLYAHVEELRRRGLVQQRGRWRAVLPPAIANRLAQRAFQNFPIQTLQRTFVDKASKRIARSFSRRLGYLHDEKVAITIASEWLGRDGLLGKPDTLNELGQEMFGNIAAVDPSAAVAAIAQATENPDFLSTRNAARSKFVRVLKSAAYEPHLFEKCVATLMLFAKAEGPGYNQNSANQAVKSLFYVQFSGTETPHQARAALVRRYLSSEEISEREFGLTFLGAALKTSNFMPSQTFDFGARTRSYGWHPRTKDDVQKWFSGFVEIAMEFGIARTIVGAKVRSTFADKFLGLWSRTSLSEKLEVAANVFFSIDGWPEGWRAVKTTIRKGASGKASERLLVLETALAPIDLVTEIRAKVLTGGQFLVDDLAPGSDLTPSEQYRSWSETMRQLGQRAGADRDALSELASDLTINFQGDGWSFGVGVGETISDPVSYLEEIKQAICRSGSRDLNFGFIRPFLHGAGKTHASAISKFMDVAVSDVLWGPYFPTLQTSVELNEDAVERLILSADLALTATFRFDSLGGGMVTETLSAEQICRLVLAISAARDGQKYAAHVLAMVIHLADDKSEDYRRELRNTCRRFLCSLDLDQDIRDDHYFETVCSFAFEGGDAEADALEIVRKLQRKISRHEYYRLPGLLNPMFKHHAPALLDEIFKPDNDGGYRTAGAIISATAWDYHQRPINSAPPEAVVLWCSADFATRGPFIAHHCVVFDHDRDENTKGWSPLALSLIDCAEDRLRIFHIFVDRIEPTSWSGSRAALVRSRAALLDQLHGRHKDIPLDEINEAKARLEQQAAEYQRYERQQYRDWDERFE